MKTFLFILLLPISLIAQNTFNLRYSLGFNGFYFTSVVPIDSGYFLTGVGANNQFQGHVWSIFAYADSLGNIVWHKDIIGAGGKHMGAYLGTLQQKNDSSFMTVGVEFGTGCDKTCLYNYNNQGDTVWMLKFSSPVNTCTFMRGDALCFSNDGGFLIGSTIQPNDEDTRIVLTKADSAGNIAWHRIYGSPSLDFREQSPVLKNINGQIILAAWYSKDIWATTSNYKMQHQFWWLDSLGNVERTYTTPTIRPRTANTPLLLYPPQDFIQTQDKGWVVATGFGTEYQTTVPSPVRFDPYIYKLDSNLNFVWDKKVEGRFNAYITNLDRVFEKADSSLIAFGSIAAYGDINYTGMIMKLSPLGDSLWARYFAYLTTTADENNISDVRPTPDGGYIICGEAYKRLNIPSGEAAQQGWLVKLDSMGCLVPGCHLLAVEPVAGQPMVIPIKVHPNPAVDFINVYVPPVRGTTKLQLRLYSIAGQLLQQHALPQDDTTYMLSTEGLGKGLYLLQLLDGKGNLLGTEKVVISGK